MSPLWSARGRIDQAPVTHLMCSPASSIDQTILACTPAGIHVSRDRGRSWSTPGRGVIGPFVRDIAAGDSGAIVATAPVGLCHSLDWGETWKVMATGDPLGASVLLDRDHFIACSALNGNIWMGDLPASTMQLAGSLPEPAIRLALAGSSLYAAGTALYRSPDGGVSWTRISLQPNRIVEDVAPAGGHLLVLTSGSAGLWAAEGDRVRPIPAPPEMERMTSIACTDDGTTVVLGGRGQVIVSSDSGAHWVGRPVDGDVVSLAVSGTGRGIAAGLASGGVRISNDNGITWSTSTLDQGSIVVDLSVRGKTITATTVEGVSLRAQVDSRLDDWQAGDSPERIRVAECDPRLQATVRDGYLTVSVDGGNTWTQPDTPLPDGAHLDDIAIGRSSTDGGYTIAAGARDADGRCTVWLGSGDGEWRRVVNHPDPAYMVSLSMEGGVQSLFAAIGDSVYRPSRVGASLFSREVIDPGRVLEVIRIDTRKRQDGEIDIIVLTANGLYHSDDDGLNWLPFSSPDGPPLTAFALMSSEEGEPEVIAAQLGGSVYTAPFRAR